MLAMSGIESLHRRNVSGRSGLERRELRGEDLAIGSAADFFAGIRGWVEFLAQVLAASGIPTYPRHNRLEGMFVDQEQLVVLVVAGAFETKGYERRRCCFFGRMQER